MQMAAKHCGMQQQGRLFQKSSIMEKIAKGPKGTQAIVASGFQDQGHQQGGRMPGACCCNMPAIMVIQLTKMARTKIR